MSRFWSVSPEWEGETAFLLGCGPSLRDFDPRVLRGRRVIAINDAYRLVPWAEVLYFCDIKWWKQNREHIESTWTGRYLVTNQNDNPVPDVLTLRCTGAEGLDLDPGAIRHGSNSGYQAIHLAYHFGAKRIVLLGYDMRVPSNGTLHWRAREGDVRSSEQFQKTLQTVMLPKFQSLVRPLAQAGVAIVNCTPGSALKCWPEGRLEVELHDVLVF